MTIKEARDIANKILKDFSVDPSYRTMELRNKIARAIKKAYHDGALNPYC